MAKAQYVDLKPDRLLLDSNFEGYKLSLDSFPLKSVDLPHQVRNVRAGEAQWSLQQLKLFSDHNNLVVDFFSSTTNPGTYYLFIVLQDLGIYGLTFEPVRKVWSAGTKVADVHLPADFPNRGDRFGVTIAFPNDQLAVVSNGCGQLTLYRTSNRAQFTPWKELLSVKPLKNGVNGRAFVVVDAVAKNETSAAILLQSVVEAPVPDDKAHQKQSSFVTQLHWITLQEMDTDGWSLSRSREIETRGNVEFASFCNEGENVVLASSRKCVFVADSAKPIEELATAMETIDCNAAALSESAPGKIYSWTQTADDVTAVFNLTAGIAKTDVQFSLTNNSISLSVAGKRLLAGQLSDIVDVDGSAWTIESNKLELFLSKQDAGRMWSDVVVGDETGEYTADPDLVRQISEKLMQYTSETEELSGKGLKPSYNSQELEECDMLAAEDACFLSWLDDNSHTVVKESDLSGRQFLFTRRLGPQEPTSICVRHDVDGVLWSFDFNNKPVEHRATFNAFGYVQASKQQRKFSTCAPDGSYSVIIDGVKHAYIYWQPSPLSTDLRNRKKGKAVTSVAKQQLVTLSDVTDEILGFHAADDCLFLLTSGKVIAAVLKEVRDFD